MQRIFTRVILLALSSFIGVSARAELPELLLTIPSDTHHTVFGYGILPLGDQNGDGCADILIYSKMRHSQHLYYGGEHADTTCALTFGDVSVRSDLVGDVNGDGHDDFVLPSVGAYGGKLNLYYGGPDVDTVRDLWFGDDTLRAIGYTVLGDDINDNGTDELISWSHLQKSLVFFELGSAVDSTPDFQLRPPDWSTYGYYSFGTGLVGGDLNGDGRGDLAANVSFPDIDSLKGFVCLYWGGAGFDSIPDLVITRPGPYADGQGHFGRILVNLGDFSGDGHDDIFCSSECAGEDRVGFIFFGGPDIDTIPDLTIVDDHLVASYAGDLNTDGYNDLILSLPLPFSASGYVRVYYGGPEADSVSDVLIGNWHVPGYQVEFGMDCAGIGDFNGDGIEDFAFSANNVDYMGEVYIYSGVDQGTAVDFEYEAAIPDDFTLSQNYPNPFNASTTIAFSLPERSLVQLRIYNVLGQRIRTLVERTLSAGTYRVEWDGRDESGEPVSSGVYLYRLSAGGFEQSKKMVLLK